jgi:hypothetical protein
MNLSAHRPQQELAVFAAAQNPRCGHESQSKSGSSAKRSGQAVFRDRVPSHASSGGDLGQVRCIQSNVPRPLELRRAMKQIQIGQFDPARLLTYLLSRLVEAHSVEDTTRKSGSDKIGDERTQLGSSPTRAAGEILKAAERRWPSRYY